MAKRPKKTQMAIRALPVRQMLQGLIRGRLQSRSDKQGLAAFLGTSESYVKQMIYHGEGGLDAWVSALVYCYDLNVDQLAAFLDDLKDNFRKTNSLRESDRLWFALDESMSEEEKLYWAQVIRVANDIEQDFVRRKKPKIP